MQSYAAAALRKAAAGSDGGGGALPRVAALAAGSVRASQQRSPLRASKAGRPPSGLRSSVDHGRPRAAAAPAPTRVGIKPATHSTRTLVPLLDETAPTRLQQLGAAPAAPAAANHAVAASATFSALSSAIGDPCLDEAEEALQAELALADRRLELLHQQQFHRRSATPEPAPSEPPLAAGGATPPLPARAPSEQPAAASAAAAGRLSVQASAAESLLQPVGRQSILLQRLALHEDLLPPEPQLEPAPIPPSDLSIVRKVTTATGTGCKDVIAAHASACLAPGACWTTRGHRVLHQESSCILHLWGRRNPDITLRITFADAASVPRMVRLEHAPSPTAAFERLGDIVLQPKSLKQLRHLFRLGKSLEVQRFCRITLVGHMAPENSGMHRVSHLLLTSALGPQRTQSALSNPLAASVSLPSVQASVSHASAFIQGARVSDSFAAAASRAPEPPAAAAPPEAPGSGSFEAAPAALEPAGEAPAALQGSSGQATGAASPAGTPELQAPASPSEAAAGATPAAASSSGAASSGTSNAASAGELPQQRQEDQVEPEQTAQPSLPAAESQQQASPAGEAGAAAAWGALGTGGTSSVDLDFEELAAEYGGRQPAAQQQRLAAQEVAVAPQEEREAAAAEAQAAPPPVMLLPMERCREVAAALSGLGLTPEQAKQALLSLLRGAGETSSAAARLTEEQLEQLLQCVPSAEEQGVLSGFGGRPEQLGEAERFMLQLTHVPALSERLAARRFAAAAVPRAEAASAAASQLASACAEVAASGLLRTLLKVSMLAGKFLNAGNENGAAAGFQVDALLKLKDVRSSRARSRTLLHFVAREAARQHPGGACLEAALPSAAAAARVDVGAARAELRELTADARRVEAALAAALEGSRDLAAAAELGAFRSDVLGQLAAAQAELGDAQAAFRHLGTFINGRVSTLADPAAFFGVLHGFAQELAAAHEENAAADAAGAGPAKSSGASKDGTCRGGAGTSPSGSVAASRESLGRRRQREVSVSSEAQENRGSAAGQKAEQAADKSALLERLKQTSLERLSAAAPAASSADKPQCKLPSPQPCMSRAALATLGGSRRGQPMALRSSAGSERGGGSSPPAVSRVDAAQLLGQASQAGTASADAGGPDKLSTPVACLLAESARLISSVEFGEGIGEAGEGERSGGGASNAGSNGGGFGSALNSASGGSSGGDGAPAAEEQAAAASGQAVEDTAATPDGAVQSIGVAEEEAAGYSTPRGEVPLHWQGRAEQQLQEAAGADRGQAAHQDEAAVAAGPQIGQLRYSASTTSEAEVPAEAAAPAVVERPGAQQQAAAQASRSSLAFSQRQRSMQQLSPTSTPLSSLGRQSSRGSSGGAPSSCGSTPRSSLRGRGSLMHRSTSPLGVGVAAAAQAEADAAAAPGPGAAAKPLAAAGALVSPELTTTPADLLAGQQGGPSEWGSAGAAQAPAGAQGAAHPESLPDEQEAPAAAAGEGAHKGPAAQLPAHEFSRSALHSRASSCDLTFYAPFTMDRQPDAFASPGQQAPRGLSATFAYSQVPDGMRGGPLGAQQQQQKLRPSSNALLRYNSADDGMLARAADAAVAAGAAGRQRAAFSLPSSPRRGGGSMSGPRPAPLNLRAVADRLQVRTSQPSAGRDQPSLRRSGGGLSSSQQLAQGLPQGPALSPVAEGSSGPTPSPPGAQQQRELAADDLADLAGLTSDHEAEWQQLEAIEQLNLEWQHQQAAAWEAEEARELLLAQHPIYGREQPAAAAAGDAVAGTPVLQHATSNLAAQLGQHGAARAPPLPSPINSETSDLDGAMARLLVSAGNTPTGPLGQGVRSGPADMFDRAAAGAAGPSRPATAGPPAARPTVLLEPVPPAPLGEGLRGSQGLMSDLAPAAALQVSIQAARLRGSLTEEPGLWAAAAGSRPGSAADSCRQPEGSAASGSSGGGGAGSGEQDGGAGVGPIRRRRGLRGFLGRR